MLQWIANAETGIDGTHYRHRYYLMANVARLYAKAGDFEQAWNVTNSIPQPIIPDPGGVDNSDRAYSIAIAKKYLAQAYLEHEQLNQATTVVSTIEDVSVQAEAQASLVQYLATQGQFSEAIALAESIQNNDSQIQALISVSKVYAKLGQRDQALQLLKDSTKQAIRQENARQLVNLAQTYFELGERLKVRELLIPAQQYAWNSRGERSNGRTLLRIARLYWDLGDQERSQQVIEVTLGAGTLEGTYEGSRIQQEVIEFYLETEQPEWKSETVAVLIDDPHIRNQVLQKIAVQWLREERYIRAGYLIDKMLYHDYELFRLQRRIEYLESITVLMENDQYEHAREEIQRLQEIPFLQPEHDRWIEFVRCLAQADR